MNRYKLLRGVILSIINLLLRAHNAIAACPLQVTCTLQRLNPLNTKDLLDLRIADRYKILSYWCEECGAAHLLQGQSQSKLKGVRFINPYPPTVEESIRAGAKRLKFNNKTLEQNIKELPST